MERGQGVDVGRGGCVSDRTFAEEYAHEMRRAVERTPDALYWLGRASEGADLEAQIAALYGRPEECARWTLRHPWAEACIEVVKHGE